MKDRLGRYLLHKRVEMVLPHVTGRLLDLGCGTNDLVRSYAGPGIGVDVYQFGGADIIVRDSARLPFEDGAFDSVALVAALNHIPNRSDVLIEVQRVLRPGGRVIVTMIPPRASAVWHLLRRPWDVDQTERGMVEGEVFGLSRKEVDFLLEHAGFTVELSCGFMLGINRLTLARKSHATAPHASDGDRPAGGPVR